MFLPKKQRNCVVISTPKKRFNVIVKLTWQGLLTHWGQMTPICVSEQDIIGSDNGLSHVRRQAFAWNNADILPIIPSVKFFIKMQKITLLKMHLNVSSVKICLNFHVIVGHLYCRHWFGCGHPGQYRYSYTQDWRNGRCYVHWSHPHTHFCDLKLMYLYSNFTEVRPSVCKWQKGTTGLGNGLASNRRQARTSVKPVLRCVSMSRRLNTKHWEVAPCTSWTLHMADSRLAPSQWETSLQSNTVSHWLGANPESALITLCRITELFMEMVG